MIPSSLPISKRSLLLDLDGTVLDTCPLLFAAFRHTLAQHLTHDATYEGWIAAPLQRSRYPSFTTETTARFRTWEHAIGSPPRPPIAAARPLDGQQSLV
jgi:beta-phosphoglucomutase-like phosphatase (HAD superfamily)